jgi:hypothetical protein
MLIPPPPLLSKGNGCTAQRVLEYPLQLRSPEVEFPFWMKHRWAFSRILWP